MTTTPEPGAAPSELTLEAIGREIRDCQTDALDFGFKAEYDRIDALIAELARRDEARAQVTVSEAELVQVIGTYRTAVHEYITALSLEPKTNWQKHAQWQVAESALGLALTRVAGGGDE